MKGNFKDTVLFEYCMTGAICIIIILTIFVILFKAFSDPEPQAQIAPETFTVIERTYNWQVVYHNETKVMYVVSDGGSNRGTFTLLVNPDGSPMVYGENE